MYKRQGAGCSFTITPKNVQGTASFTVPLTSDGGDTENAVFAIEVGPASTLNYSPPSGLSVARNRTLSIDALDRITEDAAYTVTCADATGVDTSKFTAARTTSGNGCTFTVDPVDTLTPSNQGDVTFTVTFTSSAGTGSASSTVGTFAVNIGPESTITYSAPSGLKVGRNRTLVINVLDHVTESSAYTVSCGDATGVDNTKLTGVTRSSCTFTVDPIDTLASGSQGDTTFTVPLTSTGGHTLDATFTVNVGPDSTISYTAPTGLKDGRNRTLVIDASGYVSETAGSSYTVSCSDAASVHSRLTSVARTANSCTYTITPSTGASSGNATFSITFTSDGGHSRSETITVEVGPSAPNLSLIHI